MFSPNQESGSLSDEMMKKMSKKQKSDSGCDWSSQNQESDAPSDETMEKGTKK